MSLNLDREMALERFFAKLPGSLALYKAVEGAVLAAMSPVSIEVQKSQVTFRNGHNFLAVWQRRFKGMPEVFVLVTFGLSHRLDSPRVWNAAEPYPNRWTHHVVVSSAEEVDAELLGWIREAYDFSMSKR